MAGSGITGQAYVGDVPPTKGETNLRTDCRDCGGTLIAVDGESAYGVQCLDCGLFVPGRDYIARCVGGVSIAEAQPVFDGEE